MSINACSLNENTLNSLCGRRRQAIINQLLPVQPPITLPDHGQPHGLVHPNAQIPLSIFKRPHDTYAQDIEHEAAQVEQPWQTVTVTINGKIYTQTLDKEASLPFVYVYNVKTTDTTPIVSVTDIKIRNI